MEEWMGKVIAFVNSKGGGGKTTFAWQLGNVWNAAGKKVLLIDTDPQGTLSIFYAKWATRPERPSAGQNKGSMEGISESLGRLDARLKRVRAEDWDFIVIDTPGRLAELGPAIRAADLIVSPIQPAGADYAAFAETVGAVMEYRREDRILAIPNRVKTNTQASDCRRTLAAILQGRGHLFEDQVGDWVGMSRYTLQGLSLVDHVGANDKEMVMMEAIANRIEEMINGRP
jgi:cellulose biosynthesis protein BcsQ